MNRSDLYACLELLDELYEGVVGETDGLPLPLREVEPALGNRDLDLSDPGTRS